MGVGLVRHSLCKEGLTRARRPVEEHPLGRVNTDIRKEFGALQGELDGLLDLVDLVLQPSDIRVSLVRGVDQLHAIHLRVKGAGQQFHDCKRLLVQAAPGAGFQVICIDGGRTPHQEPGACAAPDNDPRRIHNVGHRPDDQRRGP